MKREALDTYYDSLGSTLGEALLAADEDLCKGTEKYQRSRGDNQSMQPYYRRRIL